MNLTLTSWPKGWTPSADQINGDPSGLLRMDNLTLDEEGAITLIKGYEELVGNLPDYVFRTYSRLVDQTEFIWAALNVLASSIIRTNDLFNSHITILAAGGGIPCFGDCLGQVIISAGLNRIKDNGTTQKTLGIQTPTAFPVINQINQQGIDLDTIGTWSSLMGTGFIPLSPSALIFVDPTTLTGIILDTYPGDVDSVNFGVTSLDRNGDPSTDLFTMLFQPGDTSDFIKFRVEFCLDKDKSFTNYFWYEFPVSPQGTTAGTSFLLGIDVFTTVSIIRGDFNREGSDGTRDWTTLTACRITGYATAVNKFVAGQQAFTGGVQGSLNSDYQYCAINVADNGIYQALSGPGPISSVVNIYNGYATLTLPAATDPQITATWLFRQSVADSRTINSTLGLPQFYRVAVGVPGGTVTDNTTDIIALENNIPLNPFLQSLLDVTTPIIGMCGLYNARMLYLTDQEILLSDLIDPDAIDTRYTIKAFGDPTEVNLFIHPLTNNTLILATSKDLYYISGTLTSNPDGTLDITIQAIGEAYPPLSSDFAFTDGNLFYTAADGIRYTNGSNSVKISQQLDLLFQGLARFGVPSVLIAPNNGSTYAITVGRSRIYVSLPMTDGTRWLFIYDLKRQIWLPRFTDPLAVFSTQKDEVILGYALGSGSSNPMVAGGLFLTDSGNAITDKTGTVLDGFPIFFQTTFNANGQPRNRKDTFTLKIVADTGGRTIVVKIAKDKQSYVQVGLANGNGEQTFYFNLSAYTLGFRYSIQIVDQALLTFFKLYEATIEYDPRPEQQVYLRLQPFNGNSLARKRWISYSIVIDTLGNNVTMVVMIDNVQVATTTVNTPVKQTFNYYFFSETIGTDISAILYSQGPEQPFEFYSINEQGTLSEALPAPATFLVIPAESYGKPSRKRFTSVKFQINTRGSVCTYTPIIDGTTPVGSFTFTTTAKRTVEIFFPPLIDASGIDIGGTIQAADDTHPFEFYGMITPEQIEFLPPRLESLYMEYVQFGSPYRKRFRTIPIVINTNGTNVSYIPIIDGVFYAPLLLNTSYKQTVNYYFTSDIIGVDIGGNLISQGGGPFEFWELSTPQNLEVLPQPAEFTVIPPNNYGKPNRKRFTSFKFVIDTRGGSCIFTPIVDRVNYPPLTFSTTTKQTVEYFFPQADDIVGIDIGGTLQSLNNVPFEYYQVIEPQEVEVLPARLESYYTPFTNMGVAAYKRIRTVPIVIYTYGQPVTYTPIVDGISYPPTTFNTNFKQTVYYFFTTDVFGIDVGGNFTAVGPFEFYEFGTPENVEVLPVPKKFDQFQPIRFDKIGKLFSLRVRMIMRGTTSTVPLSIYIDQGTTPNVNPAYVTSFTVVPLTDTVLEIELPKNLNGSIFRVELGPTIDMFHRYDLQVKASSSGMESDSKWMTLR